MGEWIQRWQSLNQRERLMVTLAGAVLVATFFYLAVWEPLQTGLAEMRDRRDTTRQLVGWLHEAGQEAATLRGKQAPISSRGSSLLSVIDKTSKQSEISGSVKSIQPDGDTRARVRLEAAAFDDLLGWLLALETRYGVTVETFSVDKSDRSGQVDVRLQLARAAT